MLKELFLNSEIRGHGEEEGKEEEEDEKEEQEKEDEGGAKGKTNDDIFNAFTENMLQVGENRKKFAIGLDVLSLISRRVGYQRWSRTADVLLDCAFPSFFFVSKKKQQQKNRAMTAANAREHQQQEQQEQQEKSTTTKKAFVTEGEKILRLLSSRVERAVRAAVRDVTNNNEITTAAPMVATASSSSSAITTLSLKDLCRDCAKVCEGHEEIRANEGAQFSKLLARLEKEENVTTTTNVTTATTSSSLTPVQTFEQIVRSVVKNYASKPPESLPGKKIFCVTSADAARETFSAAPRMALETALSNPSEALECQCCPKSGEISASLPDPCLCYKLLENFGGESANAFELFRRFIMEHRDTSDEELGLLLKEDQDKMKKKKRTKRGEKEEEEDVEAPPPPPTNSKKKQKHTFGLDKRKVWALQARFTRACSELEFLGMASARRHKKVEFLVRTAFPLDFASK
jgi:origin recognition complex subunit 3